MNQVKQMSELATQINERKWFYVFLMMGSLAALITGVIIMFLMKNWETGPTVVGIGLVIMGFAGIATGAGLAYFLYSPEKINTLSNTREAYPLENTVSPTTSLSPPTSSNIQSLPEQDSKSSQYQELPMMPIELQNSNEQ